MTELKALSEANDDDIVMLDNNSNCKSDDILNGENLISINFDYNIKPLPSSLLSSSSSSSSSTAVNTAIIPLKRRHANIQRPSNWKDIAEHYKINRNCTKTMKVYNLELLNPSYEYWIATLGKWIKQAYNPHYISYRGRSSVIGRNIENELITIIEKYHYHNEIQPMTYNELRRNLMSLLVQHNCQHILKQVDDGELIFGKNWFSRFYKRNKLIINKDGGIEHVPNDTLNENITNDMVHDRYKNDNDKDIEKEEDNKNDNDKDIEKEEDNENVNEVNESVDVDVVNDDDSDDVIITIIS